MDRPDRGAADPPREESFLFVYGTLRRQERATNLLRGCRLVRDATVTGTLFDFGSFPAIRLEGSTPVRGELWVCPAETIAALDAYEDVAGGLFVRVRIQLPEGLGWIYVAGPGLISRLPDAPVLDSGSWRPGHPRA